MSNSESTAFDTTKGVLLPGLDGTNPLGFLAAIGTLCLLSEANEKSFVKLAWESKDCLWIPSIQGTGLDIHGVARFLAEHLKCPFQPDELKEQRRDTAQKAYEEARKEFKDAKESVKRLSLRGNERKAEEEKVLTPIRNKLSSLRLEWLSALREAVPSLELSLGLHLNASCSELRETMRGGLEAASGTCRAAVDLLAAFGSDVSEQTKSSQMQATPFCFITGSGHQNFLETAGHLMQKVTVARLEIALSRHVESTDETLSMRWNPQEDRRYAVMWSDPGKADKPKTNWAINLLGYHGLRLFSSAPTFGGLRTAGWRYDPELTWRWPIWGQGLPIDTVRSLLSHPLLVAQAPQRDLLSALGVTALFESRRVQVGNPPLHKVNFTPSYQVA